MTRLLVEDVTLIRAENILLQVRFKGGALKTVTVPLPLNAWQRRATHPEVVKEIDRLVEHNTDSQIASLLNERDLRSGEGKRFTRRIVARIRKQYGLTSRYDRLRKAGLLHVEEIAELLQITPQRVRIWHRQGLLHGHPYTDKNDCLFEHPGENPPYKAPGIKLSKRCAAKAVVSNGIHEVQCEA